MAFTINRANWDNLSKNRLEVRVKNMVNESVVVRLWSNLQIASSAIEFQFFLWLDFTKTNDFLMSYQ